MSYESYVHYFPHALREDAEALLQNAKKGMCFCSMLRRCALCPDAMTGAFARVLCCCRVRCPVGTRRHVSGASVVP